MATIIGLLRTWSTVADVMQIYRRTDRQTDGQTLDRQTDRQTDRLQTDSR